MSSASARAGGTKGSARKAARKTPRKAAKKAAKKTTKKKTARKRAKKRAPKGQGKDPQTQANLLATVKAEDPGITAEALALKLNMPFEDVGRLRYFVHEYIKDFSEERAALRMGYPADSATSTGRLLLYHAYTQLRITEILEKADAENIVTGAAIVAALWREANAPDVAFSSNSSTRIAALKELAKIRGLTAPKPKLPTGGVGLGGVMVVPFTMHPDQWEEHARQTQRELKEAVTVEV